ncbi:MAG: aminotransferase class IV [Verrucomicrobiaceae bacterium]|nr:aminotransferase class IV [Verrucomicrobiaceae bacterium]
MSSLPEFVWINGRVVRTSEARLSPFEHGYTVGNGVFETLAFREGGFVALERHHVRLTHSCAAMGLPVPPLNDFRAALMDAMLGNGMNEARLRFTVSAGEGQPATNAVEGHATMLAVATPLKPWPPTESVVIVPWTRNANDPLAGIKSTSYGGNVRALAHAKAHGAGEAIFANTRGHLCEGTGSNVFLVRDGCVLTPPLSSGCLAGVTRALVIESSTAIEQDIPIEWFEQADEAFLTSSTRDVHPIAAIDGRALAVVNGEATQRVAAALVAALAAEAQADA